MRDDRGWDKGLDFATQVATVTDLFVNVLSIEDITVQKALDSIDEYLLGDPLYVRGIQFDINNPTTPTAEGLLTYASDGKLNLGLSNGFQDINVKSFFAGTFMESFNALATSNGSIVTMTLEQAGGGDLTMIFSDGDSILDCTSPICTIVLEVGSDDDPKNNWVYILQSTKELTKSIVGYPEEEYIPVAYFLVPSAAEVLSQGTYINQNINDHMSATNGQGHLSHLGRVIRHGIGYESGIDPTGTDQDINPSFFDYTSGSISHLKWGEGVMSQMHLHPIPAIDTATSDDMHVVNWDGDNYHEISTFNEIVLDSLGGDLSNKYFTIDVYAIGNKTDEYAPAMIMLPSGGYSKLSAAQSDGQGFNPPSIPRQFILDSTTGVYIVRMILNYSGGTNTLVIAAESDKRLSSVETGGGSALGVTDHGNLTGLADDDHPQYLLVDGSRAMSGDLDMGSNSLISLANGSMSVPTISFERDNTSGISYPLLGGSDTFSAVAIIKSGEVFASFGLSAVYGTKVVIYKDMDILGEVDMNSNDIIDAADITASGTIIAGHDIITDIRWNVTKLQYKVSGDATWYDVPTV